tara:strand:+ start:1565 stop:1762 length:198 start_codon:yes stop_codon:yes gene_type:complete
MSSYDQGYTCIECEHSYDDRDGDLDERMCNECLDKIYEQNKKETVKKDVKSIMDKFDEIINWIKS